jgi:predicted deacylase
VVTLLQRWIDVAELPAASRHAFDLAVARLADGSSLTVPVQVLVGSRPKPRLVAIAGVHGDEPDGMLALLDFAAGIDPRRLRGTLVLVPVANPPAFAAHQRRSPLDGLDLNRIFPGRVDGTPSERLAYRIVNDFLRGADLVFTLHSWYATGMVLPHVEAPDGEDDVSRRSWEAAVAAGFRRIRRSRWQAGVLGVTALEHGIPVLEAEIGGQGTSAAENRSAYIEHLTRLAQHLGILDGKVRPNPGVEVLDRGLVHAPAGGMLRVRKDVGDYVEAGMVLATVTNLHGEPVAEMTAPHDGLIVAIRRFVSVNRGDVVFALYPRRS